MANNDLGVRFTENTYATKNEVSKELRISVIDGVWDKILSYRSVFNRYLPIKGVDKNQLRVCLCPTISNKSYNVGSKLMRLINEYNKLDRINGDSKYFQQTNLIKALQNIAVKRNMVSDEEMIRGIVQGSKSDRILANYLDALKFVEEKHKNTIDIDYLAELYSVLTGNYELTSFYRKIDLEDNNTSAVISRRYKSAPAAVIESMMDGLFNFIDKQVVSSLDKGLLTYYYVEFVKPFKDYNDEIAILLAKSVLAHDILGEFAPYLPLESFLNDNAVEVNRIFGEVQATSDTTYFLTYALDSVDRIIDRLLDNIAEFSSQMIRDDFFQLDEEEKEPEPVVEKAKPVEEQPKVEEPKPAEPVIVKEVVREIIREVPVPTPVVKEEVKPAPEVKKEEKIENKPQGLAFSYIPPEIDEKTASRLERHLLELDVRLKKGQAYFYARHCTLGMYYTIDQYKKAVKCVYETARTSMDQLAEFGYYEKKLVGKKFVYTPKERK